MKYELDKTSGSARRGRLVFERPQGTFSVETLRLCLWGLMAR